MPVESGYQKEDKNQQERRHLQHQMEAEGQGGVGSLGLGTESAEALGPGRSMASGIGRAQHWIQEELQPKVRLLSTSLALIWADITSHWPLGPRIFVRGLLEVLSLLKVWHG